ncbi:Conserved oligomeric Golgi complex subunit, partial [Neophaeococcomyces mojaviensis]
SVNATSTSSSGVSGDNLVDLTTPLQKTLFDLQEIDTSIHTLTSRSALEILAYTKTQNETAQRLLDKVDEERSRLVTDFERLKVEVLGRYERAEKARLGAERSLKVVRLTRSVGRAVALGRQFETVLAESGLGETGKLGREDHRALLRACDAILRFRELMAGPDALELGKVNVVRQVRGRVFEDAEAKVLDWARKIVREFSVSSFISTSVATGVREGEDAKARFTSAVHILYLLSPAPRLEGRRMRKDEFEPEYLLRSLQSYLTTAVTSSAAGIGRGLTQLPGLERALTETSARCQSILSLEILLRHITPPEHLLLTQDDRTSAKKGKQQQDDVEDNFDHLDIEDDDSVVDEEEEQENLLDSLLSSLDTSSLASYFWRSLASSLSSKVQEIMSRGGVSARTLKSNKEIVRAEVRDCVLRGSKMPSQLLSKGGQGKEEVMGNWEREAAVMVGSVVGPLGR